MKLITIVSLIACISILSLYTIFGFEDRTIIHSRDVGYIDLTINHDCYFQMPDGNYAIIDEDDIVYDDINDGDSYLRIDDGVSLIMPENL